MQRVCFVTNQVKFGILSLCLQMAPYPQDGTGGPSGTGRAVFAHSQKTTLLIRMTLTSTQVRLAKICILLHESESLSYVRLWRYLLTALNQDDRCLQGPKGSEKSPFPFSCVVRMVSPEGACPHQVLPELRSSSQDTHQKMVP